jgi:hypothetical protein
MREPKVQAHCIFIASLADEAERYKPPQRAYMSSELTCVVVFVLRTSYFSVRIAEEIPPGLAYVCLDSKGLPLALNKILTSKIIT